MKPTGATKEAMGHSPLPWRVGDGITKVFVVSTVEAELTVAQASGLTREEARANAQLIVTAVNERERLRGIAREALRFREEMNGKCGHDEAMTKLCSQCEIRAALNEVEG